MDGEFTWKQLYNLVWSQPMRTVAASISDDRYDRWHRDETLRNAHVYQIYAYLRSQVGCGDPYAEHASGLLLHPAIGETVDEAGIIQGHGIRFATVDLTGSTADIRSQLLHCIV